MGLPQDSMCGRIERQRLTYGTHMPDYFSAAQIEHFKREAKQLCRASLITHSQALDRIALANGHRNWSLLMKNATSLDAGPPPYRFSRTSEEMRLTLHKVQLPTYSRTPRVDAARQLVEDLSHRFISARNAVDFAIDYLRCLLSVPRFKIYAATTVNWEMRCWLPYAAKQLVENDTILVNRRYKPVGQITDEWAAYEAFPHLHARLDAERLKAFSAREESEGFLFNDGCLPWASRQAAAAYLQRLQRLQAVLRG